MSGRRGRGAEAMSRSVLLAVLLLGLSLVNLASAATCDVELDPPVRLFEDPTASLTADQVLALPASAFDAASAQRLTLEYSRSAYWLRFELDNPGEHECLRWLTVGEPRLQDIQVHIRRGDAWQTLRGGSAYPLEQWTVVDRQPRFPMTLAEGERVEVLVRVASDSLIILEPRLWSDELLLERRQSLYLADGITLGIVLLVVPFSLILGRIMATPLLIAHAAAVLTYILFTCVVNGYLILWPAAVPWTQTISTWLSILSFACFLGYVRLLLGVRHLPRGWGLLFGLILLSYIGGQVWDWLGHAPGGRLYVEWTLRLTLYLVLPATLLAAWLHGVKLRWMAWVVPALFLVQFAVRHLLSLDRLVPWQSRDSFLSLASTLPGVLLLVCTLVTEVVLVRRREQRALSELDEQRRAEHERLESTVATRTAQLRESLRARSSLMARISHDLRSPLVSIIDYARLLRSQPQPDYPHKIERSARQQLELIDELLEFSRGELQQLELTLAPGYLYGFLREVEEEGRFLATRQDNHFECLFAADLPAIVQADFRRLRQVLLNLLGNAAKFTRHGRITLEVSSVPGAVGECVELCFRVSDNGIGFAPSERDNLLQPFRRGSNVGQVQGSGLGLSIVTQLLGRMGSELEIDSLEQGGSRIGFRLRLTPASEHELDIGLRDSHAGVAPQESHCILLVDDVALNREWLYDLLSGYGFEVLLAADGQQALELLEQQAVDLVMTDQMMPVMDGWTLLQRLRSERPGLPVLLYSATPALHPAHLPADLAFDGEILKPADTGQLLDRIGALLHANAPGGGDEAAGAKPASRVC